MANVPVTIAAGLPGWCTKTRLREALRNNPESVTFRVESHFHGDGDLINGHQALNRDWSLEVHQDGSSFAVVEFNGDGEAPHHLQAVVR